MKKTGLLLLLCLAMVAAWRRSKPIKPHPRARKLRPVAFPRSGSRPRHRLICIAAASSAKTSCPTASFVAGGLESPNTTKFAKNDLVFLAGSGYQTGQQYEIVRELQDPNRYELFAGQHSMLKAMGQPYSELGRVRIVDIRGKMAVAHVEFSCEPMVPGDYAIPFAEKPA